MPGVAEVAPLGGFVRQYQVNVDPNRLPAYGIPLVKVIAAVRARQQRRRRAAGGVRRRASTWCAAAATRSPPQDLEKIVARRQRVGRARPRAGRGQVALGPDMRRGIADLDGKGEVVAGIVVMRQGENALDVIERVKAKLKEIEPGLPAGRQDRHRLRPLRADPRAPSTI